MNLSESTFDFNLYDLSNRGSDYSFPQEDLDNLYTEIEEIIIEINNCFDLEIKFAEWPESLERDTKIYNNSKNLEKHIKRQKEINNEICNFLESKRIYNLKKYISEEALENYQ